MLPGPGHYNSGAQQAQEAVRSQQLGNFNKSQGAQM